jgi:predicted Zn-ribbon and HTH transcriptional regulator
MHAPAPQFSSRATPTQEHAELETLVCGECGQTFQRSRTRGRKPQRCPNCVGRHLAVQ